MGGSITYENCVQPWAFPSLPSGAELRSGGWQEEEGHRGLQGQREECFGPRASERSRVWGFDIPRVSADPRAQKESWRAFQVRRPVRARQPSPCAPAVCSDQSRGQGLHGRTSCREQPTTRTDRGWAGLGCVVAGRTGPQQPSGPYKPRAKGSDHFEPTVSSEATTRRMSLEDMSGSLCGMPDGTTWNANVATNCVATAGERQNEALIYVSGVTDTRGFLTRIRESCHRGLSAQIKGERLMLVQWTADGFRATVSALRSLDGSKGVSLHTFSLPEDRCVRLLSKNLGRQMPEDVVREELGTLDVCVQGVFQLRSGRRDQEASKARTLTPHLIVSVAREPEVVKLPPAVQALPKFRPYAGLLRLRTPVCCLWWDSPPRGVLYLCTFAPVSALS